MDDSATGGTATGTESAGTCTDPSSRRPKPTVARRCSSVRFSRVASGSPREARICFWAGTGRSSTAQPEAQGQLQTLFFLTVGLVEAAYFINLAFAVLFVFVLSSK